MIGNFKLFCKWLYLFSVRNPCWERDQVHQKSLRFHMREFFSFWKSCSCYFFIRISAPIQTSAVLIALFVSFLSRFCSTNFNVLFWQSDLQSFLTVLISCSVILMSLYSSSSILEFLNIIDKSLEPYVQFTSVFPHTHKKVFNTSHCECNLLSFSVTVACTSIQYVYLYFISPLLVLYSSAVLQLEYSHCANENIWLKERQYFSIWPLHSQSVMLVTGFEMFHIPYFSTVVFWYS